MKLKLIFLLNSFFLSSYFFLFHYTDRYDLFAWLIMATFFLGMANFVVISTLFYPLTNKRKVIFNIILIVRVAVFLSVPFQSNIGLFSVAFVITFALDLWQIVKEVPNEKNIAIWKQKR